MGAAGHPELVVRAHGARAPGVSERSPFKRAAPRHPRATRRGNARRITARARLDVRRGPSSVPRLQVYSEGRPDQFEGLANLTTLHLGGNPLQVLSDMISADVLVTAKSSFSYVPAFFCEGIVLYQRSWRRSARKSTTGGTTQTSSLDAPRAPRVETRISTG